jgi:predicted nucleic-acid-binding Zn-ribbon protein
MMSMRKSNILSYLGIFLRHSGSEFRRELTLDQDRQFNTCPKKTFFKYGQHLSLLSMPFGSSQETMTTTDDNAKMKANVEDQNANFTFHLYSFSKCKYAEFYLADKGKRIKKSAVTTLSKEKNAEKKFLLSTHHMFYPIPVNE